MIKKVAFNKTIALRVGKSFWVIDSTSRGPMPGIVKIISIVIVEKNAMPRRLTQADRNETRADLRAILWKR
jgi:hypothetical protein